MRIAIVTKALDTDGAGADVPALAHHLATSGHQVTIITRDLANAQFRANEVAVRRASRLTFTPDRNNSTFCVAALAELSRIRTPDVLLTTSDSPMLPFLCMLYKRAARTVGNPPPRIVHLMTRVDPEVSLASGEAVSPHWVRLLHSMTTAGLRAADLVIASGEDMRARLAARHPRFMNDARLRVLGPWAPRPASIPVNRRDIHLKPELGLGNRFVILHHGGFYKGHDAAGLAKAIELTSTDDRILWLMTNDGPSVEQLRKEHGTAAQPHNLKYLPKSTVYSPDELAALADVHIVSQSERLTGHVAPRGLARLMSHGKTIIALAPEHAACSRILRDHHAGCVVPVGHGEILARTIWLLRDSSLQREVFGRTARYTFEKSMCTEVVFPRLERMLLDGLSP